TKWFGSTRNAGPPAPAGSSSWASDAASAADQLPPTLCAPFSAHQAAVSFGPSLRPTSKPGLRVTSDPQVSPRFQPDLASRLAAEASASALEFQMSGRAPPCALTAVVRKTLGSTWVWPIAPAHDPRSWPR